MCKYLMFFFVSWGIAGEPIVVQNGLSPKGETKTLVFEEDLRIGGGEENYLIWNGLDVGLDVNADGHFFVVDSVANHIVEFDKNGKFVQLIGRQGEGPGEFTGLKHLSILKDQSGIVLNQVQGSSSFVYFDKEMKFQRVQNVSTSQQVGVSKLLRSAIFSSDGRYVYSAYLQGPPLSYHVALLDDKMNVLQKLKTGATVQLDNERMGESSFWVEYFASWFKVITKPGLVAFHGDGSIYTSRDGKYEITKWSNSLKKEMLISRDYKPIYMSEEDILAFVTPVKESILASFPPNLARMVTDRVVKEAIVKAEIPSTKNPVFGIVPVETGELLVVHDYSPLTKKSKADIFDSHGLFVGVADLPSVLVNVGGGFFGQPVKLFFKGGYAYGMELNEFDEYIAVRYKYSWK